MDNQNLAVTHVCTSNIQLFIYSGLRGHDAKVAVDSNA